MKTPPWRSATLLLAISIMSLACSLLPWSASPTSAPATARQAATLTSEPVRETAEPTQESASPAAATTLPTVEAVTAGPYTLAVSDRYPFFETKVTIAQSLTARAGQLWIGTISGTIEEVDPQTGSFGKSISLAPDSSGGGMPMVFPIQKMVFEGDYLWVHAGFFEGTQASPCLPSTRTLARSFANGI
jgi:hypothetical protein